MMSAAWRTGYAKRPSLRSCSEMSSIDALLRVASCDWCERHSLLPVSDAGQTNLPGGHALQAADRGESVQDPCQFSVLRDLV